MTNTYASAANVLGNNCSNGKSLSVWWCNNVVKLANCHNYLHIYDTSLAPCLQSTCPIKATIHCVFFYSTTEQNILYTCVRDPA